MKRYDMLMTINNKACNAITTIKQTKEDAVKISFTFDELLEIAILSANAATIQKRKDLKHELEITLNDEQQNFLESMAMQSENSMIEVLKKLCLSKLNEEIKRMKDEV